MKWKAAKATLPFKIIHFGVIRQTGYYAGTGVVTIPGTKKVHRLEENLGAFGVELTKADLEMIEASVPKETVGTRY